MKRILIVLLAVCMSLAGFAAAAAEPDENLFIAFGDGFSYFYDSVTESLLIRGEGPMPAFDAASPAPWAGKPVKHIVLDEGITSISSGAFNNNDRLESVVLPQSIQHIAADAFAGCNSISALITTGDTETLHTIVQAVPELAAVPASSVTAEDLQRTVDSMIEGAAFTGVADYSQNLSAATGNAGNQPGVRVNIPAESNTDDRSSAGYTDTLSDLLNYLDRTGNTEETEPEQTEPVPDSTPAASDPTPAENENQIQPQDDAPEEENGTDTVQNNPVEEYDAEGRLTYRKEVLADGTVVETSFRYYGNGETVRTVTAPVSGSRTLKLEEKDSKGVTVRTTEGTLDDRGRLVTGTTVEPGKYVKTETREYQADGSAIARVKFQYDSGYTTEGTDYISADDYLISGVHKTYDAENSFVNEQEFEHKTRDSRGRVLVTESHYKLADGSTQDIRSENTYDESGFCVTMTDDTVCSDGTTAREVRTYNSDGTLARQSVDRTDPAGANTRTAKTYSYEDGVLVRVDREIDEPNGIRHETWSEFNADGKAEHEFAEHYVNGTLTGTDEFINIFADGTLVKKIHNSESISNGTTTKNTVANTYSFSDDKNVVRELIEYYVNGEETGSEDYTYTYEDGVKTRTKKIETDIGSRKKTVVYSDYSRDTRVTHEYVEHYIGENLMATDDFGYSSFSDGKIKQLVHTAVELGSNSKTVMTTDYAEGSSEVVHERKDRYIGDQFAGSEDYTYTYDNGRKAQITKTTTEADTGRKHVVVSQCDENSNVTHEYIEHFRDEEKTGIDEFTYEYENGKRIRVVHEGRSLYTGEKTRITSEYLPDGKSVGRERIERTDGSGNVIREDYRYTYENGKKVKLEKETVDEADGTRHVCTSDFNDSNRVEHEYVVHYKDGLVTGSDEFTHSYNEDGTLKQRISNGINSYGYRTETITTYGNYSKATDVVTNRYGKDGRVTETQEEKYSYSDSGILLTKETTTNQEIGTESVVRTTYDSTGSRPVSESVEQTTIMMGSVPGQGLPVVSTISRSYHYNDQGVLTTIEEEKKDDFCDAVSTTVIRYNEAGTAPVREETTTTDKKFMSERTETRTTEYEYDSNGKLVARYEEMQDTMGQSSRATVVYTENGRNETVEENTKFGGNTVKEIIYDSAGREVQLKTQSSLPDGSNTISSSVEKKYDESGRLLETSVKSGDGDWNVLSQSITRYAYGEDNAVSEANTKNLDADGNVTDETVTKYTYENGRTASVTTETTDCDGNVRISKQSWDYYDDGRIKEANQESPQYTRNVRYDEDGNMVSERSAFGPEGSKTEAVTEYYPNGKQKEYVITTQDGLGGITTEHIVNNEDGSRASYELVQNSDGAERKTESSYIYSESGASEKTVVTESGIVTEVRNTDYRGDLPVESAVIYYNSDGNIAGNDAAVYTYNDNNCCTTVVNKHEDAEGKKTEIVQTYDENGMKLLSQKTTTVELDGRFGTEECLFDDNGLNSSTSSWYDANGNKYLTEDRTYEDGFMTSNHSTRFDENGNVIGTDNTTCINGVPSTSITEYEDDNGVSHRITITYDENGSKTGRIAEAVYPDGTKTTDVKKFNPDGTEIVTEEQADPDKSDETEVPDDADSTDEKIEAEPEAVNPKAAADHETESEGGASGTENPKEPGTEESAGEGTNEDPEAGSDSGEQPKEDSVDGSYGDAGNTDGSTSETSGEGLSTGTETGSEGQGTGTETSGEDLSTGTETGVEPQAAAGGSDAGAAGGNDPPAGQSSTAAAGSDAGTAEGNDLPAAQGSSTEDPEAAA